MHTLNIVHNPDGVMVQVLDENGAMLSELPQSYVIQMIMRATNVALTPASKVRVEILAFLGQDMRLNAIKRHRELTNSSLHDAIAYVDAVKQMRNDMLDFVREDQLTLATERYFRQFEDATIDETAAYVAKLAKLAASDSPF